MFSKRKKGTREKSHQECQQIATQLLNDLRGKLGELSGQKDPAGLVGAITEFLKTAERLGNNFDWEAASTKSTPETIIAELKKCPTREEVDAALKTRQTSAQVRNPTLTMDAIDRLELVSRLGVAPLEYSLRLHQAPSASTAASDLARRYFAPYGAYSQLEAALNIFKGQKDDSPVNAICQALNFLLAFLANSNMVIRKSENTSAEDAMLHTTQNILVECCRLAYKARQAVAPGKEEEGAGGQLSRAQAVTQADRLMPFTPSWSQEALESMVNKEALYPVPPEAGYATAYLHQVIHDAYCARQRALAAGASSLSASVETTPDRPSVPPAVINQVLLSMKDFTSRDLVEIPQTLDKFSSESNFFTAIFDALKAFYTTHRTHINPFDDASKQLQLKLLFEKVAQEVLKKTTEQAMQTMPRPLHATDLDKLRERGINILQSVVFSDSKQSDDFHFVDHWPGLEKTLRKIINDTIDSYGSHRPDGAHVAATFNANWLPYFIKLLCHMTGQDFIQNLFTKPPHEQLHILETLLNSDPILPGAGAPHCISGGGSGSGRNGGVQKRLFDKKKK